MEDTNRISVRFLGEFQLEVRGRSLTEERKYYRTVQR